MVRLEEENSYSRSELGREGIFKVAGVASSDWGGLVIRKWNSGR